MYGLSVAQVRWAISSRWRSKRRELGEAGGDSRLLDDARVPTSRRCLAAEFRHRA